MPFDKELSGFIYKQPSGRDIDNSIEAKTSRLLANIVIPDGAVVKSERLYQVDGQITIDFWCGESFYLGAGLYSKEDLEKF